MDSINVLKGYGKVNPVDQQLPFPPRAGRRPLLLAGSISAILLLTLAIGFLVGAVIHESAEESAESASLASSSAESIRAVCGVTQYPESCFSSLSSSINSSIRHDPESIFKLSLGVSLKELANASVFMKQLKESSNDVRSNGFELINCELNLDNFPLIGRDSSSQVHSNGALGDCETQLDDALSRLTDSASAMEAVAPGEKVLTDVKISNIQTWVSAAMTDQETCMDGLEEMGSSVLDEVRAKLQRSKELMSNSLAIVVHIKDLLEKFDRCMH